MSYLEAPIFGEETVIKPLSGLSGSSVWLLRSCSGNLFVRKISRNEDSSLRLKQQFNKFLAFQKFNIDSIFLPGILHSGYHDDCFYIDLEYVYGVDLVDYLASANVSQIRSLGERLGTLLIEMGKQPSIEEVPESIMQAFYDKTFTLINKCPWLPDTVKVDLFLNVKLLAQSLEQKSSLCHGDLTFENILLDKNERICLIDHLDSFCPYYWQDISKLHQDLSGEWFRFRRSDVFISKYALSYLSDCILEIVYKFDQSYSLVHYGLLALTFARVLPYTNDNVTQEFILSRVRYYLDLSTNGETV